MTLDCVSILVQVASVRTRLIREGISGVTGKGLSRIYGQILQENSVMLKMCRELGFSVTTDAEDRGVYDVTLALEDR